MKVKNITNEIRKLRIGGKVTIVKPKEIVEGDKIIYAKNSFEKIKEKKDLGLIKKKELNEENKK